MNLRQALHQYGYEGDLVRVAEGWNAAREGKPRGANPYGGRSSRGPAHDAWAVGWKAWHDDFARAFILRYLEAPEGDHMSSHASDLPPPDVPLVFAISLAPPEALRLSPATVCPAWTCLHPRSEHKPIDEGQLDDPGCRQCPCRGRVIPDSKAPPLPFPPGGADGEPWCRVCGQPLSVTGFGQGETVYGCQGYLGDEPDEEGRIQFKPGRRVGDEHYSTSRMTFRTVADAQQWALHWRLRFARLTVLGQQHVIDRLRADLEARRGEGALSPSRDEVPLE